MPEVFGHLDPGHCPECEAPFELVRPGKSQASCDCQDKCHSCGRMCFHWHPKPGERSSISGWVCPVCDLDRNPEAEEDLYRD